MKQKIEITAHRYAGGYGVLLGPPRAEKEPDVL